LNGSNVKLEFGGLTRTVWGSKRSSTPRRPWNTNWWSAVEMNKLSTKILTTMNFLEIGYFGEGMTITEWDIDDSMVSQS
jgi:hypothetical protein